MNRPLSTCLSLLVVLACTAPNTLFATDPKKDPEQIGSRPPDFDCEIVIEVRDLLVWSMHYPLHSLEVGSLA